MDSFDLISSKNTKNFLAKKIAEKKKNLLIKCILISLFVLCTTNIYTIIFIFNIKSKINTMKMNYILSKNNKKNLK